MLQDIRDNTQGVISKVIVFLFVAIFALWGVESIIGGFLRPSAVAQVNGQEITEQQLASNTQTLLASLGGNLEGMDQALLEQVALNQLIEQTLVRQVAERFGMQISDRRIDQEIITNSQFQVNGVFDRDLAARTLLSQGYSVPLYREQLRESMVMSQVANAYMSSNFVTEAELQQIAEMRLQSRDFRYLSIPIGTHTLGEAIPDAQIQAYYTANQSQFMTPETVSVNYVLLDKADIAASQSIDEAIVRAQYLEESSAFEAAAERRASHILFEVGPNLSEAEALTQAQAARQRLDAGESFEDLALELSSDTASAEVGGDIGFSDGSAFPEAIEEALDSLRLGEVSGPVVSEFGVHLVMLTESTEADFPPYEEVAPRIIRDLQTQMAESRYAELLEDLSNLAFESSDINGVSAGTGIAVQVSEPFDRNGGSGIFANPSVVTAAFSGEVLEDGLNSDLIEVGPDQAVVLQLNAHAPAALRPLEEVQAEIAVILRTELEKERAATLGQQLLTALEAGQPIDSQLTDFELAWIEQSQATRASVTLNREIIDAVFAMQHPEPGQPTRQGIALSNGTYVIVELSAVNAGDIANMSDAERNALTQSILDEKARSEFDAFVDTLRSSADVTLRLPADNELLDAPL